MTYAILQISAAAYADIRGRLLALDEKLKPEPTYASEYISAPGILGRPERLVFGPVAFEALPETAEDAGLAALIEGTIRAVGRLDPEATVRFVSNGPGCRDCADHDGICPYTALPCAERTKAIRGVVERINYGLKNGFIALAPEPA